MYIIIRNGKPLTLLEKTYILTKVNKFYPKKNHLAFPAGPVVIELNFEKQVEFQKTKVAQ